MPQCRELHRLCAPMWSASLNSSSLAREGTSCPEVTATWVTAPSPPPSPLLQAASSAAAWLSQPAVAASVSRYSVYLRGREGGVQQGQL